MVNLYPDTGRKSVWRLQVITAANSQKQQELNCIFTLNEQ